MLTLIMWHNRFSENKSEAVEPHIPRHRDSKTKKPRHPDSKTKKPQHQDSKTKKPRHRNSKTKKPRHRETETNKWFQGVFSEDKKPRHRDSKTKTPRHRDSKTKKPRHQIPVELWPLCPLIHKGQNSTGTRCRGFLVLESQYRGFLVLESRCCCFLFSEKMYWNHDVVVYLSTFLNVWCFSPQISISQFFGLGILISRFFVLGIPILWYMCLHDLVFVIIVKTKKSRIIISIILLKNTLIFQIFATSICIMTQKWIRIINSLFQLCCWKIF